eukprot:scaffold93405_cov28-Prasinocladus_malaysianus.AAC.9
MRSGTRGALTAPAPTFASYTISVRSGSGGSAKLTLGTTPGYPTTLARPISEGGSPLSSSGVTILK